MDVMISVPILAPSLLAPHTLETIPGSASPTPPPRSLRSTPTEDQIPVMISQPCEAGPSRYIPPLDSYFSLPSESSSRPERPTIDIPSEPIKPSPKGKGRALPTLASAFELGTPIKTRKSWREDEDSQDEVPESPSGTGEKAWWKPGRRRAVTISQTPPDVSPLPSPTSPSRPERRIDTQRRRASLGSAPIGLEEANHSLWSSMSHQDLGTTSTLPFAYPQPSYSSTPTVRSPGSPDITPRRSSLIDILGQSQSTLVLGGPIHMSPSFPLLGLSGVDPYSPPGSPLQFDIPEGDENMPHGPPPRRSSLTFGPDVIIDSKAFTPSSPSTRDRPTSLLSASFSTTEESSAFFSPTSTDPHPLSSASTSLSRSAKSVKDGIEGEDAAKDASLTALKLQRSLEWEATQGRHRRKLEKRRMILLELVETEVAYAEDLKALVEVYLPQLHALPAVPESTAMAVGRNSAELLSIHSGLSVKMVEILKEEGLGYEIVPEEDLAGKVERVSRRLASALVDQASSFSAYNEFCSGSVMASTLVRHISQRTDYMGFEKRCQIISSSQPPARLQDLLDDNLPQPTTSNKNRLQFRDYLIMPIQRVCRYPLLLAALLGAAETPFSTDSNPFERIDGSYDVGVDVERALGAMRGVAEEADEARRRTESEIKSATIMSRLEPHQVLTPAFIRSLGPCRLIGSLDVLHHHPTIAPLVPPVKVKYLAAFLYKGYLILAKVKKGKMYEAKHFLPLEVFELIDIAEGYLPHSIRLTLREHSFDLAASCEAEKSVWASALASARDESTVPPFELPASVSSFSPPSRRMSTSLPSGVEIAASLSPNKRHTLGSLPVSPDLESGIKRSLSQVLTPLDEPTSEFGSPSRRSGSVLLLRRASPNQRLTVDRGLLDIFSEPCAQARGKAQLHHPLFLPDPSPSDSPIIDRSTMLRRRKSFLETRQHRRTSSNQSDIAFSGEVKGSIIPSRSFVDSTRSTHSAGRRQIRVRRSSLSGAGELEMSMSMSESATEMEGGADDTATSDFGTLRGGVRTVNSSPGLPPLKSTLGSFRPGLEPINSAIAVPQSSFAPLTPISPLASTTFISGSSQPGRFASLRSRKSVRKSTSVVNLYQRAAEESSMDNRAMSTPSSPVLRPTREERPIVPTRYMSMGPHRRSIGDWDNGKGETDVSRSDSSHSTGSKRLSSIDTSTTSGPDVAVYAAGNGGLTNTPDKSSGPWGTLKRTLTSRSLKNSSGMDEMGNNNNSPGRIRMRTLSAQPLPTRPMGLNHSRSNSFRDDSPSGSTLVMDEEQGGGESEGMYMLAPRRRRSVRLLQGLRSLTAM